MILFNCAIFEGMILSKDKHYLSWKITLGFL